MNNVIDYSKCAQARQNTLSLGGAGAMGLLGELKIFLMVGTDLH